METLNSEVVDESDAEEMETDTELIEISDVEEMQASDAMDIQISDIKTLDSSDKNGTKTAGGVSQDEDSSAQQADDATSKHNDDSVAKQDDENMLKQDNDMPDQNDEDTSKLDDSYASKQDDDVTSVVKEKQPTDKKRHLQQACSLVEVGSDLVEVQGEMDSWSSEVITITDTEGKSHDLAMGNLAVFGHQPKMLKCTYCHYEVRYLPHKVEQMKRHVMSDDHKERKQRNLEKDKRRAPAIKRLSVRNVSILKPQASIGSVLKPTSTGSVLIPRSTDSLLKPRSTDSLLKPQSPYKIKDKKTPVSSTLIKTLPQCTVALTKIDKKGKVTILDTGVDKEVGAGSSTSMDSKKQNTGQDDRIRAVKLGSAKPTTSQETKPQVVRVDSVKRKIGHSSSSAGGKKHLLDQENITVEINGKECVLQLTPLDKKGAYRAKATPKVQLQGRRATATPGGSTSRSSGLITSTPKSSKTKKITIIPIDKILPAHAKLAMGKARDTQTALSAALGSKAGGKSASVMRTKSSSPGRSLIRMDVTHSADTTSSPPRSFSDDSPRYIIPPKTVGHSRPRSDGSPCKKKPAKKKRLLMPTGRMVAVNRLSEEDIDKLLKFSDQSAAAKECKAKNVLMHCMTPLPVNVLYSLLCWDKKPAKRVSTSIRYKPNAGEVLLYDTQASNFDVKADGYINTRTAQTTHYGHMINNSYKLKQNAAMAAQANGKDWVRNITFLRHDKRYVLVQYVIQHFVKSGTEAAAKAKDVVETTTDSSAAATTATASTSATTSTSSAAGTNDAGDTSAVNDAFSLLTNMGEPVSEDDAEVSVQEEKEIGEQESEEGAQETQEKPIKKEKDDTSAEGKGESPAKGEGGDGMSMKEVGDLMTDLQEITTEDLVNLLSQDAITTQEPEMIAVPPRPQFRKHYFGSFGAAGVKRAADDAGQDCGYDASVDKEIRAKRRERDQASKMVSLARGPFTKVIQIINNLQDAADEGEGVVLFKYDGVLSSECAHAILEWKDKKRVSKNVRFRPSGGEIFLYDTQASAHPQDWKADGYMWRHRGRRNNGKIYVIDYSITNRMHNIEPDDYDRRFRRKVYNLINDPRYTLVQYVGDESLAVPAPHGNSVTKPDTYCRRPPSVVEAEKAAAAQARAAKRVKLDTGDDSAADAAATDDDDGDDDEENADKDKSAAAHGGLSSIHTLTPAYDDEHISDLVAANPPRPANPNTPLTPAESEGSIILMKQRELLSYELAHSLIMWSTKRRVATKCVSDTQQGDVVLYDTRKLKQPWILDGMKWVSMGIRNHKYCQRAEYSSGFRDRLFKRYVYSVPSLAAYSVVQYIGDHNAAIVDKQQMTERSFRAATKERKDELIAEALNAPPPYDDNAIVALIDSDKYPLHETDTGAGIVMFNHETKLEMPMVHSILRMANKVRVSTHPVFQPKGGDVILYDSRENPTDWKADGYVWKNYGTHGCTMGIKSHFAITTGVNTQDKRFKRHAAKLHFSHDYTLVQYIGDETLYKPRPHGNCKKTTDTYYRARPSFVKKAKEKLHDKTAPNAYKELANEDTPRRAGSVYKMLFRIKKEMMKKERMFTDEDKNHVLQLAKDMEDGFIHRVLLHPGFTLVCAMPQILQVVDTFFGQAEEDPLVFSYETTHNISRLYSITVLCVHHIICTEGTIVPVAMVMHTQPFAQVFKEALFSLSDNMRNLHSSKCVFIIDRDDLIHSSLAKIAPHAHPVHCWEKMKRDFEKEKGITKKERSRLRRDLERLLKTEDHEELLQTYEQLRYTWSKDRRDYFTKHLLPYIRVYSSRPLLQDLGLYQHPAGITTPRCQAWLTAAKPVADLTSVEPVQLIEVFYNVQAKIVNMENYDKPLPLRNLDTTGDKASGMVYEQYATPQQALTTAEQQPQQQQQRQHDGRPNIRTPVEVKKEQYDERVEQQHQQQTYVQTYEQMHVETDVQTHVEVVDVSTIDQTQLAEVSLVPTTEHETEIAVEYLDMAEEVTLAR